jgi:peptidoglycan/LPS O-acetylase OafA/YrhL
MTEAGAGGHTSFGYKPALDGLRAVAVAAVVVYHLDADWAVGGYLGVDAFFVLSGFLISSLLLHEFGSERRIDLRAFWVRRARRLLPAMLLVVAGVALWAAAAVPSDELDRLRGDSLATLFYSANWRFVATGQSYFDLVAGSSPLEHMWSLAIEEQFYLVWPLVVLIALVVARGRATVLAAICVGGIGASITAMAWLYDGNDPSRAYFGTDSRAHALLIGALLAILLMRGHARAHRVVLRGVQALGVAGGLTVLAFMALVPDSSPWMYRGGFALFAVAVATVVAAAVAPGRSPVRALLALAPLVWVGRISYGIYLWHWPVQTALSESNTGLGGVRLDALRVAATVTLATVSFLVVEQPIRRGALRPRLARVAAPAAIGGVVLAVVVVTSAAVPPPTYLQHAADADRIDRQLLLASEASPAPPSTMPRQPGLLFTPSRVLLVGDSTAASLLPGLEPEATRRGVAFFPGPIPGCGVISGTVLADDGTPIEWAKGCADEVVQKQVDWVNRTQPDLVIWYSSWETADRLVDGQIVRFGTEAGNAVLMRLIDEAVSRLTATGARVVFPTVPPPVATPTFGEPTERQISDVAELNSLLGTYAATHANRAFVVDLAGIVCPGGHPCPSSVDGVVLRPKDGRHFHEGGPAWVASRLLDAVLTPRPLPGVAP